MHLPVLPSFDEELGRLLKLAGVPAVVLFLIATAFAVKSWADAAAQAHRGVKMAAHGAQSALQVLRQMAPAQRASRFTVTVLVPLAQLLLLGFCYVIGNILSWIVSTLIVHNLLGRNPQGLTSTRVLGYPVQSVPVTLSGLHLDYISGAYLLFGIVCLGRSYRLALHRNSPDSAGKLLALPATFLGRVGMRIWILVVGFIVLGLVLNLAAHAADKTYQALPVPLLAVGTLAFCLIAFTLAALYYAACIAGARASGLLIDTWWPSPVAAMFPAQKMQTAPLRSRLRDYLFWSAH